MKVGRIVVRSYVICRGALGTTVWLRLIHGQQSRQTFGVLLWRKQTIWHGFENLQTSNFAIFVWQFRWIWYERRKERAKILGYFAQRQHMTSLFSNSREWYLLPLPLCRSPGWVGLTSGKLCVRRLRTKWKAPWYKRYLNILIAATSAQ